MKPRISIYYPSNRWSECTWKCTGGGCMGIGRTPKEAYWDWAAWTSRRGVSARTAFG